MRDDDPTERELIDTLRRCLPTRPTADPLAIAYETGRRAGRCAARRAMLAWNGIALLVSASLCALAIERAAQPPHGVAAVEKPVPTKPPLVAQRSDENEPLDTPRLAVPTRRQVAADAAADNVIVLRDAVLLGGLDALPRRPIPTANPKLVFPIDPVLLGGDL